MRAATAVLLTLAAATAGCSKNPAPAATAPQAGPATTAAAAPAAPATAMAAPAAAPAAPAGVDDLTGTWGMNLDVQGQTIPIVIHLTRGATGSYTGDAAPEGQSPAGLTALTLTGDRVSMTFSAPEGEAVFAGTLASDRRSVTGTLAYQGQSIPFVATKR